MKKRKVCVVLTDKAQLSRLLPLMKALKASKAFHLQLIVGGAALTYRYGGVLSVLKKEGFKADVTIPMVIEGGDELGMAKTAAIGMLEFATALSNLKSDIVVVRGDRYEVLPIATAVTYLNKLLVHIEGGDQSGSIDESVRHAITKLAHIHFVTNAASEKNVLQMGEARESVYNVGSLDVDFMASLSFPKRIDSRLVNEHGVGSELDLKDPYLVVMQHPVTTEIAQARKQIRETLAAVHKSGFQALWIWPNIDAGSDAVAKKMREWQIRRAGRHSIRFVRYLNPYDFLVVLNRAHAIIGNSSAGIKEASWLGVPAVNIGNRQQGRMTARNVFDVSYDRDAVLEGIRRQATGRRYKSSTLYGDGTAAKQMVRILSDSSPALQKRLAY